MSLENKSDIKDQIIKNSFWNIIGSLINKLGGFILVILISRLLMPEGFGRYSLAITISFFFITFSDLGINQTLIRYVSLEFDKKNDESAAHLNYLFKIKFLITLIISLILFISSYPLSFYVFKDSYLFLPLLILSFYVFFISLSSFFESLFFVRKKVKYICIKEFLSFLIKLVAIILIGYFSGIEFKLESIFLSFIGISILIFFFDFYLSKHFYPSLFKKTNSKIDKKGILKFILFINIQTIAMMVLSQATILFLGIFLEEKYIGYYNASWTIITGIAGLLFSFSYTLLPIFASLEEQRFKEILKRIFNLFFILALPISFGVSLLSKYIISAIYGYDYLPASISLSILSFVIPCIAGTELSLTSLSARYKLKKISMLMLFSAGISLILNYIFIKLFLYISNEAVITGISIANLLAWLFCFISSVIFLRKELHTSIISLWILKPIFSCLIMSASIHIIMNFFGEMNILSGIFIVLSGIIVYFASLYLLGGIRKEDIIEIKSFFKLHPHK